MPQRKSTTFVENALNVTTPVKQLVSVNGHRFTLAEPTTVDGVPAKRDIRDLIQGQGSHIELTVLQHDHIEHQKQAQFFLQRLSEFSKHDSKIELGIQRKNKSIDFFENILKGITYKENFRVAVDYDQDFKLMYHIQISMKVPNAAENMNRQGFQLGEPIMILGRSTFSPDLTEAEFVALVFNKIKSLEVHELEEQFKYKGAHFVNPHPDERL